MFCTAVKRHQNKCFLSCSRKTIMEGCIESCQCFPEKGARVSWSILVKGSRLPGFLSQLWSPNIFRSMDKNWRVS
uniref:Uncharacterized protein n=1 Tax=Varanus komodoensis TaxID=61221 RepID=A0A8D2KZU3_VARKO